MLQSKPGLDNNAHFLPLGRSIHQMGDFRVSLRSLTNRLWTLGRPRRGPILPPLPVDVIINIIIYIRVELEYNFRTQLYTPNLGSSLDHQHDLNRVIYPYYSCLRGCMLLSRAWCGPSTEALYSHVVILHLRQLKLFVRTLSTSPSLVEMIKSCSVIKIGRAHV